MLASRTTLRATRAGALRSAPIRSVRRNARFQSTESSSSSSSGSNPALVGGLAGGAIAFGGFYAWYHFSGAKSIVKASKQAKSYVDSASQKFKEAAPEPNEALEWLRNTALSYAAFVPGAKQYVNSAFNDLDTVRSKHGDKVDNIVREAYNELRDVAQGGINMQNAQKAWDIIEKHMKRIGELAGDAASEIINNHPELKDKVGGRIDQLKQMGEAYGPEAKKQVDQTWDQIRDIMKSGVSADTAKKIQNLVQEKSDMLRKMGDEAWKKGLEQAKPYLDKNPKVKEVVEKNADSLKQGNLQQLWEQVRNAVESGDTGKMEEFVKSQVNKAKQSGFGGLEQYLQMIPGASEIAPKLGQLQEVAQKHGKEAEKLLKETVDEIQQILSKRSQQAKELAEKAEKEAK
ncbi:hypothetical protein K490DRAFT_39688 [Saccharata proteae CBS 121410]|uniref:Uncharacterized protein n=1 Tax=Saccharata proteae CBS 121410 TaxID=1314787 RepID=A0A9P4LY73_9PEZI|nr:hypothetical protein K490DRAFT_39688 [Saccharata proteae CBS 121410]